MSYDDREETVIHISECSQKVGSVYKNRCIWLGHTRVCKKSKFEHTIKCYMHNLEKDTRNCLQFRGDKNRSRNPDQATIKKKKKKKEKEIICCPGGPRSAKQKRKDRQVLAGELRKLWNMRMTVIPIVIRALGTVPKRGWKSCKSEDELKPSMLQHCWDWLCYSWEMSWKLEEIAGKKLSANADLKNWQGKGKKINHLLYMDDIKLFAKNEKE